MKDFKKGNVHLMYGDCLERMQEIQEGSIDLVLTDPPYGTTNCAWDTIIPLEEMWECLQPIVKSTTPIILFGSEPFSSLVRLSNLKQYKYDLYWRKEKPTNFFQLKKRFGKTTETISIFYEKQCTYNPQKVRTLNRVTNKPKSDFKSVTTGITTSNITPYKDDGTRYPNDILEFRREVLGTTFHPTQKPVELLEYLIKTYTKEGDTVLDFTMGSGSTGVACQRLKRKFIGIELDKGYFEIAKERILNYNKHVTPTKPKKPTMKIRSLF